MVNPAVAAPQAAPPAAEAFFPNAVILIGLALFAYFMIWRPHSKRAKEHRDLMSTLQKGDEVLTSGGILGKVSKITDEFVVLAITDHLEIKLQKSAIVATLPKGTLAAI